MIPRFKLHLGWDEFRALFRRDKNAVQEFEKKFAQAFKSIDAISFPYGRSAQWAFFNAMGIKDKEIIMPAYTCSVVAHAVTLSGNRPRFVDIQLDDYNMDLDLIPKLINENTKAIIATHTFGYPQNIDRLESIINEAEKKYGHKIWLMQDCCHAFGAEWNGRMIGTSGDVSVYAFNISKIMTTIFGGILTFQDPDLANKVRKWRDANYQKPSLFKSWLRRLYLLSVYIAFSEKFYGMTWWLQEKTSILNRFTSAYHLDEKIHFPPDYKDLMLDVEAAVGLEQLKKYNKIIQKRRENALWYHNNLRRRDDWIFPPIRKGATYSHYVVRVPNREKVINEYAKKGIHLGKLIQYSIPNTAPYKKFGETCKNANLASKQTINFSLDKVIIEN